MDYIYKKPGEIDYPNYQRYLQSIRDKLAKHIYAFAADISHLILNLNSSLHDAWLESLIVNEVATGERNEIRQLEVKLALLGSFHDRRIHLHYSGVSHYAFNTPRRINESRHQHTAHGDLFTHEIRLGHNGLFVHELLFERGASFLIECADIRHSEEMSLLRTFCFRQFETTNMPRLLKIRKRITAPLLRSLRFLPCSS